MRCSQESRASAGTWGCPRVLGQPLLPALLGPLSRDRPAPRVRHRGCGGQCPWVCGTPTIYPPAGLVGVTRGQDSPSHRVWDTGPCGRSATDAQAGLRTLPALSTWQVLGQTRSCPPHSETQPVGASWGLSRFCFPLKHDTSSLWEMTGPAAGVLHAPCCLCCPPAWTREAPCPWGDGPDSRRGWRDRRLGGGAEGHPPCPCAPGSLPERPLQLGVGLLLRSRAF